MGCLFGSILGSFGRLFLGLVGLGLGLRWSPPLLCLWCWLGWLWFVFCLCFVGLWCGFVGRFLIISVWILFLVVGLVRSWPWLFLRFVYSLGGLVKSGLVL